MTHFQKGFPRLLDGKRTACRWLSLKVWYRVASSFARKPKLSGEELKLCSHKQIASRTLIEGLLVKFGEFLGEK